MGQVVCMTFSLIQCKCQASRSLYHPLSAMRKASRLLSALSPTCVEEQLASSSWYSSQVITSYMCMKPSILNLKKTFSKQYINTAI